VRAPALEALGRVAAAWPRLLRGGAALRRAPATKARSRSHREAAAAQEEDHMLDIRIIRENPELVRDSIAKRKLDPARIELDRLLLVDAEWRRQQGRLDELRGQRNEISASIKNLGGA
jgi:hypothetical protein